MILPSTAEHIGSDLATDKIRAVLVRLCADASEPQVDLARALLTAIDDTILARQLTLCFGPDTVARLTVSHRRILCFDLTDSLTSPAAPDQPHDRTAAQQYAQHLQTLVSAYQNTGFKITRHPCQADLATQGCSVRRLVEAGSVQLQDTGLSSLLAQISANADAWVFQKGDPAQYSSFGPDPLIQRLLSLSDINTNAGKSGAKAVKMPAKTPNYLVLTLSSDTNVIVASDRGDTLLIALPAPHLPHLGDIWRRIFCTH